MSVVPKNGAEPAPVVIYGSGAVAHYVLDICESLNVEIRGIIDGNRTKGERVYGVEVLGDDSLLCDTHLRAATSLVVAIGNIGRRREIYERAKNAGYAVATLIHPSCVVSPHAIIGEGAIVNPFTSIRIGARLGNLFLCEGHSRIGYANLIGDNVVIATNVMLNAETSVGDDCFLGTSATLLPYRKIGNMCFIAAGALVTKDVPDGRLAIGQPAAFERVSPIVSEPLGNPSRRSASTPGPRQ